jgi:hypothetical protein
VSFNETTKFLAGNLPKIGKWFSLFFFLKVLVSDRTWDGIGRKLE